MPNQTMPSKTIPSKTIPSESVPAWGQWATRPATDPLPSESSWVLAEQWEAGRWSAPPHAGPLSRAGMLARRQRWCEPLSHLMIPGQPLCGLILKEESLKMLSEELQSVLEFGSPSRLRFGSEDWEIRPSMTGAQRSSVRLIRPSKQLTLRLTPEDVAAIDVALRRHEQARQQWLAAFRDEPTMTRLIAHTPVRGGLRLMRCAELCLVQEGEREELMVIDPDPWRAGQSHTLWVTPDKVSARYTLLRPESRREAERLLLAHWEIISAQGAAARFL